MFKTVHEVIREQGYGEYESFTTAADTIGITRDELSDFMHARKKFSRLEVIRIPWLERLAALIGYPTSDVIEAYRYTRWGGWVYLVFSQDEYKIGRTGSLDIRIRELGYKHRDMSVLHTIPTNDSYLLEHSLHKRYSEYHLHGDWFSLPLDQVDLLKSVKKVTYKPLLPVNG